MQCTYIDKDPIKIDLLKEHAEPFGVTDPEGTYYVKIKGDKSKATITSYKSVPGRDRRVARVKFKSKDFMDRLIKLGNVEIRDIWFDTTNFNEKTKTLTVRYKSKTCKKIPRRKTFNYQDVLRNEYNLRGSFFTFKPQQLPNSNYDVIVTLNQRVRYNPLNDNAFMGQFSTSQITVHDPGINQQDRNQFILTGSGTVKLSSQSIRSLYGIPGNAKMNRVENRLQLIFDNFDCAE